MDLLSTLIDMQSGRVAEELNLHWSEVLDAVMSKGGKGKFTLTLHIKPTGVDNQGNVSQVEIDHAVTVTKPTRKLGSSFFYTTPSGKLSRKDSRQQELDGFGDESPIKPNKERKQ